MDRLSLPAVFLAACVLLAGASLIDAPWPEEQALQQIGTAVGVLCYFVAWKRWSASTEALLAFASLLVLHVIGARWSYSFVPYDTACEALLGFRLGDHFGWTRNHYDRFVHAAYGLFALPIFAHGLRFELRTSSRASIVLAGVVVIATSALYELAEWLVAMLAAPERADRYLGQQGDAWDAQKDMALATVGACVTAVVLAWRRRDS